MSNRLRIDLVKLTRVLARPPAPRMQPDRRPRACCGSRQGFPHFDSCVKLAPVVRLTIDEAVSLERQP